MIYSPLCARHEAGHAIAALDAGLKIVSVEVYADGRGLTRWRGHPIPVQALSVCYAGHAADQYCRPGIPWMHPGYGTDRACERGVLHLLWRETPEADWRDVRADLTRRARFSARWLIEEIRARDVLRLARVLARHGRLTGRQVREVVG